MNVYLCQLETVKGEIALLGRKYDLLAENTIVNYKNNRHMLTEGNI